MRNRKQRPISHKRKIELPLVDMRIRRDVHVTQVVFDLFQDLAFAVAEGFCDIRMNTERCVSHVVQMLRQPAGFGKELRVLVGGTEVCKATIPDRTWRGNWRVAPHTTVVWIENLRAEPLAPAKK